MSFKNERRDNIQKMAGQLHFSQDSSKSNTKKKLNCLLQNLTINPPIYLLILYNILPLLSNLLICYITQGDICIHKYLKYILILQVYKCWFNWKMIRNHCLNLKFYFISFWNSWTNKSWMIIRICITSLFVSLKQRRH